MKNLLDKAICFAVKKHSGAFRKGTNTPYIVHPVEALAIAATMTEDEEVLAGAVLHDTVEDTDTTIAEIRELFGERVAELVAAESENKRREKSSEDTWKIRKEETLEHLKTAPREVKIITLGDKLSNMRAIFKDYVVLGDKVWDRFNQKDKNEHYWYYSSIAELLSELEEYPAWQEYDVLSSHVFNENNPKIDFYTEKRDDIEISISISLVDGELILEGNELGETVDSLRGMGEDFDYSLSLDKDNTARLFEKLKISNETNFRKLELIRDKFAKDKSIFGLEKFCEDNSIETKYFSWP